MTRPRQTFGGKTGTGIWWRKRSWSRHVDSAGKNEVSTQSQRCDSSAKALEYVTSEPRESSSTALKPAIQQVSIGWDDDLCRPIYNHPLNMIVSSESDEKEDDVSVEDGLDTATTKVKSRAMPFVSVHVPKSRKRRTKTFGDRKLLRRPLSLILSQEGCFCGGHDNDDSSNDADEIDKKVATKRRRVATAEVRMDSLATLPLDSSNVAFVRDDVTSSSRHDIHSDKMTKNSKDNADQVPSDGSVKEDVFTFHWDSSTSTQKSRPDIVGSLSLDRARDFFAELDKTQKLIVDASSSPVTSSRVVRTTRRVDFSSPRINKEYQDYVEATKSLGISPLSIKDFVSSRQLHFQTKGGAIFDGFLDD